MAESLIDLTKKVGIVLTKVGAPKIVAQVGAAFDVSGSAQGMYSGRGSNPSVMQGLVDRLFALGYKFDDNATLDAWTFSTGVDELEPVVESMFSNYIPKYVVQNNNINKWGGTNYTPALRAIDEHYHTEPAITTAATAVMSAAKGLFGKMFGGTTSAPATFSPKSAKPLPDPAFILFVTDGENSDTTATEAQLQEMSNKQIYIMFIGITDSSSPAFAFLKRMESKFPNVGFYNAGQVQNVSDEVLYTELLNPKFVNWYKTQRGIN